MKQTAVEWLVKALEINFTFDQKMQFEGLFQQAKEMEYKQLKDVFINGGKSAYNTMQGRDIKTFEEYYDETFKNIQDEDTKRKMG